MKTTRVQVPRGPVQCSGAPRPARFRCPRFNARAAGAARRSSALALGLLALGLALAGAPALAQTVCTPTDTTER